MEKKISFNKKIMKAKTSSHFIIIEKVFLDMLGVGAEDTIKVTIERVDDNKLLKKLAMNKITKENVKSLAINEDGIFGEIKKEDHDNDIDNELPKD